jgi:hypothetical protein
MQTGYFSQYFLNTLLSSLNISVVDHRLGKPGCEVTKCRATNSHIEINDYLLEQIGVDSTSR